MYIMAVGRFSAVPYYTPRSFITPVQRFLIIVWKCDAAYFPIYDLEYTRNDYVTNLRVHVKFACGQETSADFGRG